MSEEPVRILAPLGFASRLTRRQLIFGATGAAGATLLLSACGSDKKESGASTGATTGSADASNVTKASGSVQLYTWGDYHDPDLISEAADVIGVDMAMQFYASNEELIAKLEATKGNSGYDLVVPTGPYLPQMISKELLLKIDRSKIPNWKNLDAAYLGREWDPQNEWAVPRDWGSTGFMYDSSVVKRELKTWNDFFDAAANEASGQTSALDTADNVLGPYFWANGISWNTEKTEDLDAAEKFLVEEFAPHIKAFDSYPSTKLAEGAYSMSAAWNGDARQAYFRMDDAGMDSAGWKWVLGAPMTEIWMDHYCIPADAKNPDGAHAWINWMLDPNIAFRDLSYIGYNMTVAGTEELAKAASLEKIDMIYFTAEQLKNMEGGIVNSAQNRKIEIYNKVKAAAGA
jgi:spermidine/putrescine transport system substrate-binding protein